MAFGRMGAGFARVGLWAGTGGVGIGGGGIMLADETDGLGIDFTYPSDGQRVAKNVASVTTQYGLDGFLTNTGATPKLVYDSASLLVWNPHNLFLNSAVPATQSVTTIVGLPYTVTVTGTGSLTGSAGASGVASAGAPLTFTATTTTSTFTLAGSLTQIQMNRGTVATAYLATTAAIRCGCAVDYDPVTRASRGLLVEAASTNFLLQSSVLTNASWVKVNMTTALTATGPDGVVNNATTITATAGNATALQTLTSVSQVRITSVFLKRRTGSGNVDITQDNGSTWSTQAITSTWARYSLASVTSANPVIGIRLVTSGDAVDVAYFQHETVTTIPTSPIPTFASTQTRTIDHVNVATSTFPWSAAGSNTVLVNAASLIIVSGNYWALHDGTDNERYQLDTSSGTKKARLFTNDNNVLQTDLGAAAVPVVGTYYKTGVALATNDFALCTDGGTVATDTVGTLPTVTTLVVGGIRSGTARNMYIKTLVIVPRRMTNVELQTKTA